MIKLLLIEDNDSVGWMIDAYFDGGDYEVLLAKDGVEGRKLFMESNPDVILMDINLPDIDGITLCKEFRLQTESPIIMVSGIKEVDTKIKSLSAGADDYLMKPFSLKELEARIHAQLRARLAKTEKAPEPEDANAYSSIKLDHDQRFLKVKGKEVELTNSEFEIVKLLMRHPGRVFSREEILSLIRNEDTFVNDRSIDVHITNVRKKIAFHASEAEFIKTVWGSGYKYV